MNFRQREMARRTISCTLVVLYLLVATAANLFHTEFYQNNTSSDQHSQTETANPGNNITAVSSNQLHLALLGDYCPVCAFFKNHQSQTSQTADFISLNTPPAFDYTIAGVFIPHKHLLPAIPTRGPPSVFS
ncbi:MAG: hypothetical protein GY869_03515 [Planctomycetes bacterium]|nr:hypothetical protein [Planctomycetota bacterium]